MRLFADIRCVKVELCRAIDMRLKRTAIYEEHAENCPSLNREERIATTWERPPRPLHRLPSMLLNAIYRSKMSRANATLCSDAVQARQPCYLVGGRRKVPMRVAQSFAPRVGIKDRQFVRLVFGVSSILLDHLSAKIHARMYKLHTIRRWLSLNIAHLSE